jgi:hypothetical protein
VPFSAATPSAIGAQTPPTGSTNGECNDASVDCSAACSQGAFDSDADGTPDCTDGCADDPAKVEPGSCGCGHPEIDRDVDGASDCVDACPDDPLKISAGACGCGATEPAQLEAAAIYCLKSLLRHRYSFAGADAIATDSVSAANGTFSDSNFAMQSGGAALLMSNALSVAQRGPRGGYVALPAAVLHELSDATFEVWLEWQAPSGVAPWQRIMDFGTQRNNAGGSYLCLMPLADDGKMRAAFSLNGLDAAVSIVGAMPLVRDQIQHVALVVEHTRSMLRLYVEGVEQGSVRMPGTLADLAADKLWLGRSLFAADPGFDGRILEFRVYSAALTEAALQASLQAGPDYDFRP